LRNLFIFIEEFEIHSCSYIEDLEGKAESFLNGNQITQKGHNLNWNFVWIFIGDHEVPENLISWRESS